MQTAAAVLALEDQGRLSRDDSLSDLVPQLEMDLSPRATDATVHQLLSHQGGFVDYTPIQGLPNDDDLFDHATTAFAELAYQMAPAGSFYNYSNPNFSLAGLVAEQVAGMPYVDVMREEVWGPLCMDRSFFAPSDVLNDGDYAVATSLSPYTGQPMEVFPGSYQNAFSRPAGFAWSNVLDMLHFAHFLLEGNPEVMGDELRAEMTLRQVDMLTWPETIASYGYGVIVLDGVTVNAWREIEVWQHGGALAGYSADLYIVPDANVAIAVLANSDGAYFGNAVATVLDELVALPAPSAFPDARLDELVLEDYVGVWDDPFNVGRLTLSVEEDTLLVSAPALETYGVAYNPELRAFADDRFVFEVQGEGLELTFVPDESGQLRWLRHRVFVAERSTARSALGPIPPRAAVSERPAAGAAAVPRVGKRTASPSLSGSADPRWPLAPPPGPRGPRPVTLFAPRTPAFPHPTCGGPPCQLASPP